MKISPNHLEPASRVFGQNWNAALCVLLIASAAAASTHGGSFGQKPPRHLECAWWRKTVERGVWGVDTSLAFDSEGRPAIAYVQAGGTLALARFNGANWNVEVVDDAVAWAAMEVSLAFGPDGRPSIAYSHWDLYDNGEVKYARHNGVGWVITVVEDGAVNTWFQGISLAFAPNGEASISFAELGLGLRFARLHAGIWNVEALAHDGGWHTSLAFESNDHPAIAYTPLADDGSAVRYARFDGASWQLVDAAAALGRAIGVSLAFGADQKPSIAYAYSNAGVSNIRFSRHNGIAWVDSALGPIATEGAFPSLAFDAYGRPAIAYLNLGDDAGQLHYASYNGASWTHSHVDGSDLGYTGQRCSLAFGPDGKPAIAYLFHPTSMVAEWESENELRVARCNPGPILTWP
jgi:hypothetical protein